MWEYIFFPNIYFFPDIYVFFWEYIFFSLRIYNWFENLFFLRIYNFSKKKKKKIFSKKYIYIGNKIYSQNWTQRWHRWATVLPNHTEEECGSCQNYFSGSPSEVTQHQLTTYHPSMNKVMPKLGKTFQRSLMEES